MQDAQIAAWPVPFFFGGRTCLDFVNTADSRSRPAISDYLPDSAAPCGSRFVPKRCSPAKILGG